MSSKLLTYCLLFFIATTNCVEPYDFKPTDNNAYLVIDGIITQANEINRVRLTNSTAYGTNTIAKPIENAKIKLLNSNNESEYFIEEGDGYYAHYGFSLNIQVGETYHIEISIGEKKYQSIPEKLPEPIVPDSVSFKLGYKSEINTYGIEVSYENIDVFINTPINVDGEKSYLRWKTNESWSFTEIKCSPLHNPKTCYMTRELNEDKFFIYSSEAITGTYLSNKFVANKRILDNVEFIERHYFNVEQYTITKEAYAFWERAVQIASPSGDIFDLPPAQFSGNVYNVNDKDEVVLGYFEVAGESIKRILLYRDDIHPITITSKDYLCRRGSYVGACCQCLVIENSNSTRPDYW